MEHKEIGRGDITTPGSVLVPTTLSRNSSPNLKAKLNRLLDEILWTPPFLFVFLDATRATNPEETLPLSADDQTEEKPEELSHV
ncbi:hypothetical protein E2C01_082786 [Portunus trituberculatus]|uniref:Uncharacterized protein n=1 Tax=Portunus trituberculatus TaxID=210409 RepID=A0A5B7J1R2_PORTR|nr:hypothetical protein [Portunus trituberculatus]